MCGVNPITNKQGIISAPSGKPGELRPGKGGKGHFGAPRSGGRKHKGIDIAGTLPSAKSSGSSVYAFSSGTVKVLDYGKKGYGKMVIIDHGNGLESRYSHLSDVFVKNGQKIDMQNPIGKVGQTGNAEGQPADEAHVHFETRFNGKPINPKIVLNSPCSIKFWRKLTKW